MIQYLLACWALTFLIRSAKITARPRQWIKLGSPFMVSLLRCTFCTGIWASLILCFTVPPFLRDDWRGILGAVLAGAAFTAFFDALMTILWAAGDWLENFVRGPSQDE